MTSAIKVYDFHFKLLEIYISASWVTDMLNLSYCGSFRIKEIIL